MYMHIWSPIDAVIVDTSAYHREQCDFIGIYNKILPAFFDLIDERNILLLTHPVLDGEIKQLKFGIPLKDITTLLKSLEIFKMRPKFIFLYNHKFSSKCRKRPP